MSVLCNKLECDTGKLTLEQILINLFAQDANGCVGIKMVELDETNCANLTDLKECGSVLTVEQAVKMALVDDGCGGFALGVFKLAGAEDPDR